jgi:tetratricopeptide (TPR) repeat protein
MAIVLSLLAARADGQEFDGPDLALIGEVVKTAPLLEGMGSHTHPVTTGNPLAQRYFNQGLALAFGFNHAEAARSFREVQKLDPDCAMAYWGEAWVLGPNINLPMPPENAVPAWEALQRAVERLDKASPREQDYIRALATRYAEKAPDDRAPLDRAFADAMRDVAAKHPDDYDAQIVFVEALMDTSPWNYWDGHQPKEFTKEALTTLERVLARNPDHPQACHLYIHAVEAVHPEWAVACADRLDGLCPGAGHLVHMPSHIFVRVGRYADAVDVNEMATEADDRYVAQCHAQGMYPMAYMPHNHHFIWFGACLQGRSERALEAACHIAEHVDTDTMRQPGMAVLQHFSIIPLYSMVRFGAWDLLLAEPQPAEDLPYPRGIWHFCQGMAHLRQGRPDAAEKQLEQLKTYSRDDTLEKVFIWQNNSAGHLLRIAEEVLSGELAADAKDYDKAIAYLREAARIEDSLVYEEPQSWYAPTRLTLGALLLEARRAAEAELAFREDLHKYPRNGWGLFGLKQALEAQGKQDEAAHVAEQFEHEWRRADVSLKSARF